MNRRNKTAPAASKVWMPIEPAEDLSFVDQLMVLVRSPTVTPTVELAIRQLARQHRVPLEGEWKRADQRMFGIAGIETRGSVLEILPAHDSPDEAWNELPAAVSALPEVEVVFVTEFYEEDEGDVCEGYAEFVDGDLKDIQEVAWDEDEELHSMETLHQADAYVWNNYPLSKVARRLKLDARPVLTRWASNKLGRNRPQDTPEQATIRTVYLPQSMADEVAGAAEAVGVSNSKLLCDLLGDLGPDGMTEAGKAPRSPGGGPKVTTELYLSQTVYEALAAASVDADCSLSHIIQQAWLARPAPSP